MSRFGEEKYFKCFFVGCSFGTKNHSKFEKHIEKCSGVKDPHPRHHRQLNESQNSVPEAKNEFANRLLESISAMGKLRTNQNTFV